MRKNIPVKVRIFEILFLALIVIAGAYFEREVLFFSFAAALPGLIVADYWHIHIIRFRPLVIINAAWIFCGIFVALYVESFLEKIPGYLFAVLAIIYYSVSAIVFGVASKKFPIIQKFLA